MGWRQVILLWVVAAGLGAEYWWFERRRPATDALDRPARRRLLEEVRPEELREVRLERDGRRVVLRRGDAGWSVVEPPEAVVPPDLIAAFTSALLTAEEIERLGPVGDLRGFGLEEGADRVEVVPGSGASTVVTLGDTNPTGTAIYAQRADGSPVVLIGRNVRYYEDLIFQALPSGKVPTADGDAPVGG